MCRLRLKCDGTRVETRFRLSAKQTSPFKSAGAQFIRLLAAEVVMLDTPCSEVVRRVLATHSIRQFPLHFPSRASPCVITFQLDSATTSVTLEATRLRAVPSWVQISAEIKCHFFKTSRTALGPIQPSNKWLTG